MLGALLGSGDTTMNKTNAVQASGWAQGGSYDKEINRDLVEKV